ncbi:hypothetical protein [Chelatococcus asaccharovorans]|uniref:Putative cupin superfamily protein n=1 Tax=Chelatococcus asaccharovorans TaxID=28210 RepID=A0A2V3TUT3_9HYPH|nr:hypothetical protein [Chelatococcus asaccharovorans]MBS7706151.1 hypothetical protein [Chelatococcus asaccharovorans]PXW52525.1 putative cupin superfamily protein [Chelatococcus asaccharovorans]
MALIPLGLDGLGPRPPLDAAILDGPGPEIRGQTYLTAPPLGVSIVAWGATPYAIHPKTRPDYEFSILLEGQFDLSNPMTGKVRVHAGDLFVLPPTFSYRWAQTESTLKFALSYRPESPVEPMQDFTLIRRAELSERTGGEEELFRSHDRRLTVTCLRLPAGSSFVQEPGAIGLGTVLSGSCLAEEHRLEAGCSFALDPSTRGLLQSKTDTILVICQVR